MNRRSLKAANSGGVKGGPGIECSDPLGGMSFPTETVGTRFSFHRATAGGL
jgi:hypothetical protein